MVSLQEHSSEFVHTHSERRMVENSVNEMDFLYILIFLHFSHLLTLRSQI